MSDTERTLALPTTTDVRWWWVEGRGEGATQIMAGDQFDEWLNGLLAAAWDAGFDSAGGYIDEKHNPFRGNDG